MNSAEERHLLVFGYLLSIADITWASREASTLSIVIPMVQNNKSNEGNG